MEIITSSQARNNFAAIWDMAKRAPIIIQKQGRDEMVMLTREAYDRREKNKKNGLTRNEIKKILAEEEEVRRKEAAARFVAIAKEIRSEAKKRGMSKKIFDEIMASDV
jgi:PHD/YefM family antitoxin component YafN of YafNO toxin-antitoxin module